MIGCPTRRTLARRSLLLLTFPIQKIAPTGSSLRRLGLLIRSRVLLQFRSVLHMTCVFVIRIKMESLIRILVVLMLLLLSILWLIELLRSEEHTSELQSRFDLVCRLLLE